MDFGVNCLESNPSSAAYSNREPRQISFSIYKREVTINQPEVVVTLTS